MLFPHYTQSYGDIVVIFIINRFQESPASRTETSTEPGGVLENPIPRDISQDSGFVDGTSSSQTSTQACDENKIQHRSKATDTSVQSVVSLQTLVFTVLAAVTRLWLVSLLQGQVWYLKGIVLCLRF